MSEDPFAAVLARAEGRVGSTVNGKWRLERLLGVGGMASVYEATHRNRKRAAVKMLHPELSMNASVRERFLREGYVANSVGHPGAVAVDDDDVSEDGCAFLVMELLEGETLEARWERKGTRLPADEVLALADQVLGTLTAAHEKGIVHRDLKPENLFLTRTGAVKILDFGIARLRELSQSTSKTQTGSTMGTPAFMPPEQARGRWEDVDGRSDLWALGATMFTLLTGRYVHEAGTVNEALVLAVTQKARSVASLNGDLAFPVVELVDRALAYDKAERWTSATTMQVALRRAYSGLHMAGDPGEAELARPITMDGFDDETVAASAPTGVAARSAAAAVDTAPRAVLDANIPKDPAPAKKPGALTTARGVVRGVLDQTKVAGRGSMFVLVGGVILLSVAGVWFGLGWGTAPATSAAPAAAPAELGPSSAPAPARAEPELAERATHEPGAVRLDELPVDRPPLRRVEPKPKPASINLDELPLPPSLPISPPGASSSQVQPATTLSVRPSPKPPDDPFARRR